MSGNTKEGRKVRPYMNDLISLHCSDTVLLMLFPGNLEDLETIVSAIFGSLSLVCVTEKKKF